jgi:hypothetical protein
VTYLREAGHRQASSCSCGGKNRTVAYLYDACVEIKEMLKGAFFVLIVSDTVISRQNSSISP